MTVSTSKQEQATMYTDLLAQLDSLVAGESNWIANLANISALLFDTLGKVNWAGFYLRERDELILGPFQGKPACIRIGFGKGVCGTAAQTRETQRVANVHDFPGHIACDSASLSEVVVPLLRDGEVIGVLDIDSPIENRFDEMDQKYLEQVAQKAMGSIEAFNLPRR
jgi:L-methionine (R)-S-oxide reductase